MEPHTAICCRGCLQERTDAMKNVEDKWDADHNFGQLINYLMGSDTNVNSLPELLCGDCETSLIAAYLFKRQCSEAEKTFLKRQLVVEVCLEQYQDDAFSTEDDQPQDLPDVDESETNAVHKPTCLKCTITFNSNKEYQHHYRTIHRERTVCSLCGKMVIRHNLEKHQLCHRKAKEHTCDECGRSFTLIENLRKHVRIHTGDDRYECEHCGKKFVHWNSKRCHVWTKHTGEMNYECSVCGKKFAHSSNMLRHVRYHTGELPHECSHCAKKFNTTSELRDHLVTHTKEKNEVCEICSKAFGTRKALRNHQKTHTGARDYACFVCEKTFTQPHVLRSHLRNRHPDYPMPPPGTILSRKKLALGKNDEQSE